MKAPLITVGLTTFNAINTLDRAIASALAQTWQPIEFIVVDDASNDGTYERLLELAIRHLELKVLRNSVNCGVAVSRNRILSSASGEFVVFFDDDDVSLPWRIASQYERITRYERDYASGAPVVCHTARRVVYPNGENRNQSTMGQTEGRYAPAGEAVARRILMGHPLKDGFGACPTCSQMARLSTYFLIGGFDSELRRGEDTDFNIRLAIAGGHFVGIQEPLVCQIMTATSDKSLAEEYRNMRAIIVKHRSFIEKFGQYAFCLHWLDAKQAWFTNRFSTFFTKLLVLALRDPLLTVRRIAFALPNIGLNKAFIRFHGYRNRK